MFLSFLFSSYPKGRSPVLKNIGVDRTHDLIAYAESAASIKDPIRYFTPTHTRLSYTLKDDGF